MCLEPRRCIDTIINPAVNTTFEKSLTVRGPDQLPGHVINPQRAAGLGITRCPPSHFLTNPYHNRNDGTPSSDATAGISEWACFSLYPGKKRTWTMTSIGRFDVG